MSLEQRIQEVEQRIEAACARAGRNREDVQVIAVTKYVSLQKTGEAIRAGLQHIGENRWQDAAAKWEAFSGEAVWHYIGHLQTNKVKEVVGRFAYIHSLDRLSLAKEINKKAAQLDITVPCLIQVNVSGEETKYGLHPDDLLPFAQDLTQYRQLKVCGLMTMAPYESEPEATRPVFRGLRQLRDELNADGVLGYEVLHLSMGMSNDFEVAIEEGATWVRLGSVLVGHD